MAPMKKAKIERAKYHAAVQKRKFAMQNFGGKNDIGCAVCKLFSLVHLQVLK